MRIKNILQKKRATHPGGWQPAGGRLYKKDKKGEMIRDEKPCQRIDKTLDQTNLRR